MQITIYGRNIEVTEALKNYITKKAKKLEKYSDQLIETHVILSVEKYRQCAEISIFGKNIKITEKTIDKDMYPAIDDVCYRLGKALSRLKDKMKVHRKKDVNTNSQEEIGGLI